MRAFHIFLRTLGVRGVKDTQCGFKVQFLSFSTRLTSHTPLTALHPPDRTDSLPHDAPPPLVIRRRAPPPRATTRPADRRGADTVARGRGQQD